MITIIMYDGVTASALPKNALAVAGYNDGRYRWSAADWARFPTAHKMQIAVGHLTVADCLDIETGNDMNPADWVSWANLVRAHGRNPIAYMNTSTWPSVRKAFTSRGVKEPLYWVAQYDGKAEVPAGSVGKQYASNNSYDTSLMDASIFGVSAPAPTPAPAPGPAFQEDDDMHMDLELNVARTFTNPAAVRGGSSHLALACDFGTATVRVAQFSLKAAGWTVNTHSVDSKGGAVSIGMDSDVNKVSVTLTSTSNAGMPVSADVL